MAEIYLAAILLLMTLTRWHNGSRNGILHLGAYPLKHWWGGAALLIPLYLGGIICFSGNSLVVPDLARAGQKSWFMRAKHLWLLILFVLIYLVWSISCGLPWNRSLIPLSRTKMLRKPGNKPQLITKMHNLYWLTKEILKWELAAVIWGFMLCFAWKILCTWRDPFR